MQANLIFEEELTPKRGVKIPVGIHTNCNVTSLEVGDGYVDINFSTQDGLTHNKRLWEPKGKYQRTVKDPETKEERTESVEEARTRETRTNLSHLAKVAKIFLTQEELTELQARLAKTPEYKDVVLKISAAVNPVLSRKTVNLKLIADSERKYSTFTKSFPDYIEEYVEGVEPTLAYTEYELKEGLNKTGPISAPVSNPLLDKLLS